MSGEINNTYLDYAATTPVDARVLESMLPYFNQEYGNPSSIHAYGQRSESAVENARQIIAKGIGCAPDEIIFTASGSESDNMALRGAAFHSRLTRRTNRVLISPVEHHAVSHTAAHLHDVHGFNVDYLPVDEYGMVSAQHVMEALDDDVAVVSVIFANNEIGSINPIAEIGALCREKGVPFHTDAVQAAAHLAIDVAEINVDLLAIGAHKFYGPKGVGALYIRKGIEIIPTLTGGSQEKGLRPGTSNVPLIVGMAIAFEIVQTELEEHAQRLSNIRDQIISSVLQEIPQSRLTGHPEKRLPNHASFVFENIDGNALLINLDVAGFACSSGSACKTGSPEPSEVLTAIGIPTNWGLGSLRVSLGRKTQQEDVDSFLRILPEEVRKLRANM